MREMEVANKIGYTLALVAEVIMLAVLMWGCVTFNGYLVGVSMVFLAFMYIARGVYMISDLLTEQKITNALLVEQLVIMDDELEACEGDCESCICGLKEQE